MRLRKGPTLEIRTTSDYVLLAAEETLPDDSGFTARAPNTIIRGTVVLDLPKPRLLRSLNVSLLGKQLVVIEGLANSYGMRQCSAELENQPRTLPAGNHEFPFELVVPAEVAASERCPYGRTSYKIVATALGLGKLGSAMLAEHPVTLVATHNDCGGLPPGYSLSTVTCSENLGAIDARANSPYLLVGGLLNLHLRMPNLLRPVHLEDVRVEIHQTYDLRALDETWRHEVQKADPIIAWSLRSETTLGDIDESSSYEVKRQIQLPPEGKLRPTTPSSSVTGIRVSHRVAIIIVYSPLLNNPKKQKKEFKIASGATISSCRCTLDALQLPAYQRTEAVTPKLQALCLCAMSHEQRIEFYGHSLEEPLTGERRSSETASFDKVREELRLERVPSVSAS